MRVGGGNRLVGLWVTAVWVQPVYQHRASARTAIIQVSRDNPVYDRLLSLNAARPPALRPGGVRPRRGVGVQPRRFRLLAPGPVHPGGAVGRGELQQPRPMLRPRPLPRRHVRLRPRLGWRRMRALRVPVPVPRTGGVHGRHVLLRPRVDGRGVRRRGRQRHLSRELLGPRLVRAARPGGGRREDECDAARARGLGVGEWGGGSHWRIGGAHGVRVRARLAWRRL